MTGEEAYAVYLWHLARHSRLIEEYRVALRDSVIDVPLSERYKAYAFQWRGHWDFLLAQVDAKINLELALKITHAEAEYNNLCDHLLHGLDEMHEDYLTNAVACGLPTFEHLSRAAKWQRQQMVYAFDDFANEIPGSIFGRAPTWGESALLAMVTELQADNAKLRRHIPFAAEVAKPITIGEMASRWGVRKRTVERHAEQLRETGRIAPEQASSRQWLFTEAEAARIKKSLLDNGRSNTREKMK